MGEVYRAHDSKLGRAVAIKLLPEAWAFDPERLARFEREARVLASLNHPHIAALYGFEEAAGRHLLVMELVDGETLADRLARGPMPVDEALNVAHQIAEALESAHEKGIVHRDLKPANVKITPEDRVKVLDFGLARLPDADNAASSATANSPTLSVLATQAGMIMGTAGYMSPEQAKGAVADHRSDMFSFGAVLYEMVTGRRAFHADTPAETMAAVLMREPDFGLLPPNLNPRITDLLRRCLDKHPRRRWQAAGDLRAEIEAVRTAPHSVASPSGPGAAPKPLWARAIPLAATAALASAVTGGLVVWSTPPVTRPPIVRFPIALNEGDVFANTSTRPMAISPDGTRVVYASGGRLYSRELSKAQATPVPGTEQMVIAEPVFSPDSQSIVFVSIADRVLKRVGVGGGPPVTLGPVEIPFSLGWGGDAVFVAQSAGIMRIPDGGGNPETIVKLENGELARGPQLLPDGQTLLFTSIKGLGQENWNSAEIVAYSLGSGSRKIVRQGGGNGRYLTSGHLVYSQGGVLFAAPFDVTRLELSGPASPVLEGVSRSATGGAQFDISETGSLVYIEGPATLSSTPRLSDLVILDERGGAEVLKVPSGPHESPRISPDGTRVAFGSSDGPRADIWIYDLDAVTTPRKLTFGGNSQNPIWSADGRYVVFQSDRGGDLAVFRQLADVSGASAERLTTPSKGAAHIPESWSRQGDLLLFSDVSGGMATLWTYSLRDRAATQIRDVRSSAPLNAEFSPDGRWITYTVRGGSALTTIYVEPFPATGAKTSIPGELAHHPMWSPDGRSLFYVPGAQSVVAVSITKQPALGFGSPRTWSGKLPNITPFGEPRNYDLLPDGKRFIYTRVNTGGQIQEGGDTPQIRVVVNWAEELRARK
jgi:eukaryotic-like serine/threonine-protein kinase